MNEKKLNKLLLEYVDQYPNEPPPSWLLWAYGTERTIEILENRRGRKIGGTEPKDGTADGEEFEYI